MNNEPIWDIEYRWKPIEPITPENYVAQYVVSEFELSLENHQDVWNHIKSMLKYQIFEKLGDKLLSDSPVCIVAKYVTWNKFDSFEKVVQLRVQLQKFQAMNIIMPKWEPVEVYQGHQVEVKVLCAACGNVWIQSSRGACSSCGSPASWSIK